MERKNIKLRVLELTDSAQMATLLNNKNIWDNLRDFIPFPYHQSDAVAFIKLTKENEPRQNLGIEYNGVLCGEIGLNVQHDVYKKSAEIGYWLGEPYWGKGIMTEAVRLITNYGFEELNLVRIYTGIFEFNKASMHVLEKNGYRKEAIFKKAIFKNDKIWNEHRYFILNKD